MKFRYGFVTNSSSSSFILGFKSRDDINRLLEQLPNSISHDRRLLIIQDIEEKISDKETVLNLYYEYCYNNIYYCGAYNSYDDSDEEQIRSQADKRLNNLNDQMDELSIISVVTYGDDTFFGTQMEQEVLPFMPCTLACLSYH